MSARDFEYWYSYYYYIVRSFVRDSALWTMILFLEKVNSTRHASRNKKKLDTTKQTMMQILISINGKTALLPTLLGLPWYFTHSRCMHHIIMTHSVPTMSRIVFFELLYLHNRYYNTARAFFGKIQNDWTGRGTLLVNEWTIGFFFFLEGRSCIVFVWIRFLVCILQL
jgi:hypothetical protein